MDRPTSLTVSTSDGRQVTSTPAVIFVVIADRPGDTSCTTGRPYVSGRRRPGLEWPTILRHVAGVGTQTTLGGKIFVRKYVYEKLTKFPNFT